MFCDNCKHQAKESRFEPVDIHIHGKPVTRYRCPVCSKLRFVTWVLHTITRV